MMRTKLTKTVLLIDFSGEICPEPADQLRGLNYVVLISSTVEESLRQIRDAKLSVIFVNSAIPEDAGETILKTLRQKSPATPVVLVVSGDSVPEKFGSIPTGAFTLLVRPVTTAVLEHTLRQVESGVGLLERNGHRWPNTAMQNATLEALVESLERQNRKLQREHVELSKNSAGYGQDVRENEAMERQLSAVQTAIDGTREAVLILGADGRVQYCNRAFQDAFGFARIDAEVYPIHLIFADPGMNDKIRRNIEALGTFSCEVSMIGHDGAEIPTYVNANAVSDGVDGKRGMLYLIADLSEQEQLRKEAYHDALTGLYTRGHFLELLSTHTSMVARHEQALSLCLCDLDDFKQVNDTYGHRMGDRVLEMFAWIVSQEIRNEDCAGRIGGDEFILALPQVDASVAAVCMERIRKRFEAIAFKADGCERFRCSVTLGLADYPDQPITDEEFIELADKSLYRAKELGRNCTVVNMEAVGTTAA